MDISLRKFTVEIFANNILIRDEDQNILAFYSNEDDQLSFQKRYRNGIKLKIAEIIAVNVHKFLQQISKSL